MLPSPLPSKVAQVDRQCQSINNNSRFTIRFLPWSWTCISNLFGFAVSFVESLDIGWARSLCQKRSIQSVSQSVGRWRNRIVNPIFCGSLGWSVSSCSSPQMYFLYIHMYVFSRERHHSLSPWQLFAQHQRPLKRNHLLGRLGHREIKNKRHQRHVERKYN